MPHTHTSMDACLDSLLLAEALVVVLEERAEAGPSDLAAMTFDSAEKGSGLLALYTHGK